MCKFLFVFSLLCYFFVFHGSLVKAQVQEGTPCETPNRDYGLCISVYSCKVVTDILSAALTPEKRSYVKSLACGTKGSTPLVCCPQSTTRSNPDPVPVKEGTLDSEEINNDSGVLLSPPECGLSNASLPKVVGGVPAKLGEFPWITALGYRNRKNPNQPRWLCGGTLISSKHVLTAGHCVQNRDDLYLARLGEHDLYDDNEGANPVDIPIAQAKVHENYNPTKFTTDIAILTLEASADNINGVWPICLPWESDKRSKSFLNNNPYITGWGALYFNGPKSSVLQVATVQVLDNSNCERAYQSRSVIDERIICAGDPKGEKDACQGDSGGPLMYGTTNPKQKGITFYLIGIVSYGIRCAEQGYPGVYTRVTRFLPWIQQNLV